MQNPCKFGTALGLKLVKVKKRVPRIDVGLHGFDDHVFNVRDQIIWREPELIGQCVSVVIFDLGL